MAYSFASRVKPQGKPQAGQGRAQGTGAQGTGHRTQGTGRAQGTGHRAKGQGQGQGRAGSRRGQGGTSCSGTGYDVGAPVPMAVERSVLGRSAP